MHRETSGADMHRSRIFIQMGVKPYFRLQTIPVCEIDKTTASISPA
jgi:hypothetical protein